MVYSLNLNCNVIIEKIYRKQWVAQMINYYEVLGVSQKANKEEIRKAYRNIAKSYHPDVNDAANASAMFRLIEEAYSVLYNDESRKQYDLEVFTPVHFNTEPAAKDPEANNPYKSKKVNVNGFKIPNRSILINILFVIGKIIAIPLFVIALFFEKVFMLVGGLMHLLFWILFGIGVIIAVISLFEHGGVTKDIIVPLLMSFIFFIMAYGSLVIPSLFMLIREGLKDFITYW